MCYQAEDENERPFALKRERRQSQTVQRLIQREPVTKSPFKQPVVNTERQSLSPPRPLFHLLPTAIPSSPPSTEHFSLAPSVNSVLPANISPGRSSLVSRRMHGPRLSSGSQSRRQRRKTVTWDENCDVVEISADENETDSEDEKEAQMSVGGDYEEEFENDPFFRGAQLQNDERVTDELSYENSDSHDASSDDGPSLGLDPDASISGLVEEMFASSSGKTIDASLQNTTGEPSSGATTSIPSIDPCFPLDDEDRIPLGRSYHTTQSPRHLGECSRSPKPSPPQSPSALADFYPQQLFEDRALNLVTRASHTPSATPPGWCSPVLSPGAQTRGPFDAVEDVASCSSSSGVPSPVTTLNVSPSHVTPTLSMPTHGEWSQLGQEEDCDDLLILPGTPSSSKIVIDFDYLENPFENVTPGSEVGTNSSGMWLSCSLCNMT